MQNKPQLTAEIEQQFDKEFGYLSVAIDYYVENAYPLRKESGMKHLKDIKHFLATALEEQRMKTEVETGLHAFGVTMEEIAKARADEREKVLSEVLEMVKHQRLSPKDGYFTDERKRHQNSLRAELRARLNQLKGHQ